MTPMERAQKMAEGLKLLQEAGVRSLTMTPSADTDTRELTMALCLQSGMAVMGSNGPAGGKITVDLDQ